MANQMMPRPGSVRHPAGRPGHGLRGSRKGSPSPSPRPGAGKQGMTPAGSFNSRPDAGQINPRGTPGRNTSSSYGRFGAPRGGKASPRPSGKAFSPRFGGRY